MTELSYSWGVRALLLIALLLLFFFLLNENSVGYDEKEPALMFY